MPHFYRREKAIKSSVQSPIFTKYEKFPGSGEKLNPQIYFNWATSTYIRLVLDRFRAFYFSSVGSPPCRLGQLPPMVNRLRKVFLFRLLTGHCRLRVFIHSFQSWDTKMQLRRKRKKINNISYIDRYLMTSESIPCNLEETFCCPLLGNYIERTKRFNTVNDC